MRSDGVSTALGQDLLRGVVALLVVFVVILATTALSGGSIQEFFETVAGFTIRQRALFVLIGIDAAMVEETIFRGRVQPAIGERFGPIVGLLGAAVLHAVGHMRFHVWQVVSLIAISAIFGAARRKDGSIAGSGIGHFLTWAVIGAA